MNQKPWGYEVVLWERAGVHAKLLHLNPGARLSLQRHAKKQETLFYASGDVLVSRGDEMLGLHAGEGIAIEPGAVHRICNRSGSEVAEVLEVSYGDDSDVERLADDYNRV